MIPWGVVTIDARGTILEIASCPAGVDSHYGVEFYSGILIPGFVNAHTHLELSYLKNVIPQHTGLIGFITAISNLRHNASYDEQLQAAKFMIIICMSKELWLLAIFLIQK